MVFLSENNKKVSELITALKGRSEIPLKFVYIGRGAKKWEVMDNSNEYKIGNIEQNLLRKNVDDIYKTIGSKNINILDIGCGSGLDAIPFLEQVQNKQYFCFDISPEMLELAAKNINNKLDIQINKNEIDFEEGNFAEKTRHIRKNFAETNLLLFLGHTLGNPSDRNRVLANLKESMISSDWLLVGVEMIDESQMKKSTNRYCSGKTKDILMNVLEELGAPADCGALQVSFNVEKSQVEFHFIFNKSVKINYEDEEIDFNNGDEILLGVSYKFTDKVISDLLTGAGFVINKKYADRANNYCLILCQPKSYKKRLLSALGIKLL